LDRLHSTLREYLEQSSSNRSLASTPASQKQARLHMPISSPNSAAYTRADTGFGAAPADKPRLEVFALRERRGLDSNLIMEFEEAGGGAGAGTRDEAKAEREDPAPGTIEMPSSGQEDRSLPLLGISIVAFILLMAAAALYYLQTARNIQPVSSSVEQRAQVG